MLAVAEHENLQSWMIPRIATGFCGGQAYTGNMCGAVSGGIMAIGLLLGRDEPKDLRDACYAAVRTFKARFSRQFGSVNCPELTGVQLGTPEGMAEFRAKNQIKKCAEYVFEATQLVLETAESGHSAE